MKCGDFFYDDASVRVRGGVIICIYTLKIVLTILDKFCAEFNFFIHLLWTII